MSKTLYLPKFVALTSNQTVPHPKEPLILIKYRILNEITSKLFD